MKKVIREMLSQRGYKNIEENKEENILTAIKQDGKTLLVFLNVIEEKLTMKEFNEHVANLLKKNIAHGIIICHDMTSATKQAFQDTKNLKLTNNNTSLILESFHENQLQFNITKHRLVPKHTKINLEENKELKEYIKRKPKFLKNIPHLKRDDAIVKFYNWRPGDLIEIERKNGIVYKIVK